MKFAPGFWAFTFAWAAVAFSATFWLNATKPDGFRIDDYLLLAAIHLLIGGIAARTVIAMRRGQLLPKAAAAAGSGASEVEAVVADLARG